MGGDFELNPQSLLYKMVVSKYRILTPFSKRHSDLEFFWDKKNKNVVMNKFYAKAKIDKDGSNVANVLISTNQKPYKFHVFLPALLGKLRPGMQEVDVDFDHNPGTSLEMKVNHAGAEFQEFQLCGCVNEAEFQEFQLCGSVNEAEFQEFQLCGRVNEAEFQEFQLCGFVNEAEFQEFQLCGCVNEAEFQEFQLCDCVNE